MNLRDHLWLLIPLAMAALIIVPILLIDWSNYGAAKDSDDPCIEYGLGGGYAVPC